MTTTTNHILAMRSESGEVALYDTIDKFMASFKNGKWVDDAIFEYADLEEDFRHIGDDDEVMRLMREARAGLGQPLSGTICHEDPALSEE